MANIRKYLLPLLLIFPLLLTACGARTVEVGGENVGSDVTELSLVVTEEELRQLDGFENLEVLDLSGSTCYYAITAWANAHPDVEVRYTVALPDGQTVANDTVALDLSGVEEARLSEAAALLVYLPKLETVSLGLISQADTVPEFSRIVTEARPAGTNETLNIEYTPAWRGQALPLDTESLDLREASAEEISQLLQWLPTMTSLKTIELGEGDGENSRISWETVSALEQAAPGAAVRYRFTLYGKDVSLQDETLDLNHIRIDDQGALVKRIALCMPALRYLDMDFCGVDDESMADIRDSLPDAEVVWRVWFGAGYTTRTDTTRILASNPGIGGQLTYENTRSLQYCTKVKYLDLGHNRKLTTIDFCAYMPDLEVLVAAISAWTDASPLANCTHLEYAELQTCGLSDLRPLSELHELRHLNICYDFAISDISPLYGLENLERLWIGMYTPVPAAQVEELLRRAPNCEINTTDMDPTREGWRWSGEYIGGYGVPTDRYGLLIEQMGYDNAPFSYAYIRNDPLYAPHGQGDNTTPPAWFTEQVAEYARGED